MVKKGDLLDKIIEKAKKTKKIIVFPEQDERVLKAIDIILKKKIARVILLGNPKEIAKKLNNLKLKCPNLEVHNPKRPKHNFANELYKLRKEKGLSKKQAEQLIKEPIYYGTMLVKKGVAHGLVSGAEHPTAHTFRPALQIIKSKTIASTFFIMKIKDKTLFFADCALNINPDEKQLAQIAIHTANSAKTFGFKPKVAMLSFSTKGSAKHESLNKIIEATKIAKRKLKGSVVDGEIQVDAALVPEVAKLKKSNIKGDANVLIFPDLNSGNIGYKLVQRLADAKSIGPITQGLNKPINDLSRGCSIEDIIYVSAITAIQK